MLRPCWDHIAAMLRHFVAHVETMLARAMLGPCFDHVGTTLGKRLESYLKLESRRGSNFEPRTSSSPARLFEHRTFEHGRINSLATAVGHTTFEHLYGFGE